MRLAFSILLLAILTSLSFSMTPQECTSQAVSCGAACCAQAGCTVTGSGDDRYCNCVPDAAEAQWDDCQRSVCVPEYNECIGFETPSGTPGGGSSGGGGCCGSGLILLLAAGGGLLLARRS